MGFIKAIKDSVGSTLANQWLDYYGPKPNMPATAVLFPSVQISQNSNRGNNINGNIGIITNGSKIMVPDNMTLITIQDGGITGFIAEPGGYIFQSNDINSQSFFSGGGLVDSVIKSSWEKFKAGGIPMSQQSAFYVNLKEIPNNKFGTQSEIYWDDVFLNSQASAICRGTYTLKVTDPITFIKNYVPSQYITDKKVFDFADMENDASEQLFNEVVGCLGATFSNYTNDANKGNRISKIQGDSLGFAQALSNTVEEWYQWKSERGLSIVKAVLMSIEYGETTKKIMEDAQRADSLMGARGNSFMQQSVARGIQNMGEQGNGQNMMMMGFGMNGANQMMGSVQQPNQMMGYHQQMQNQQMQQNYQNIPQPQSNMLPPFPQQPQTSQIPQPQNNFNQENTQKLIQAKQLLEAGVISQEEFDKMKKDILGL